MPEFKHLPAAALFILLAACSPSPDPVREAEKLNALINQLSPSRADATGPAVDSMSVTSFGRELAETRALLADLNAIDTSVLKGDDRIDWKFAKSILSGREIEQSGIMP